jgi:hypothetical protein
VTDEAVTRDAAGTFGQRGEKISTTEQWCLSQSELRLPAELASVAGSS